MKYFFFLSLIFLFNNQLYASDFDLLFPVKCAYGNSCWILNYMDSDGEGNTAKDFTCGTRTYDGHIGTDIAIQNLNSADEGVKVIAAADGTIVQYIRDIPDRILDQNNKQQARRIPCGNGLVIEHMNGWKTYYCHLKQDSIPSFKNNIVTAGDIIGEIGLSGLSSWPHLGFTVSRFDEFYDPFSGRTKLHGCGLTPKPIWKDKEKYRYQPFSIFNLGFHVTAPQESELDINTKRIILLPTNTPSLNFWAYLFGTQKDDRLSLTIQTPDGKELAFSERKFTETKSKRLVFIQKNRFDSIWQPGAYRGIVSLERGYGKNTKILEWETKIFLR